jgi:dTDP-4-amino-4,6-dideoxygalactose transaminase
LLGHYRDKYGFVPFDFPVSFLLDKLSIALPLFVQMSDGEQVKVLETLRYSV